MAGHRYWRLTNVTIASNESNYYIAVAEIRFNDIATYNLASVLGDCCLSDYPSSNAFDGNPNTFAHTNNNYITLPTTQNWWIGYCFDEPIVVNTVSLQMRQDLPAGYDRSWQTADVEYSNDGITWEKYGTIFPNFAYKDLSIKTVSVISLALLTIPPTGTTDSLNLYTQNEQGSITGTVKEIGLPENAEVGLYDRKTRQLIALTRSVGGVYSFIGIDKNREYYVHAIDDHRQYNAVTQDMIMGNYDDMKAKGLV